MSVPLSALHVTHRYPAITALDDVSLSVPSGSLTAIVGESGSGKSTLMRCFNRMVEPSSGTIKVGDEDVCSMELTALRRRLGYVQQHGGLLPHWSVEANVGLVTRAAGRHDGDAVREALAHAGLGGDRYRSRLPHELSGGQRQRVALARALAGRPEALLLDEPFGALDAISRGEVQEAFAKVQQELGLTMLLVTHDIAEAARLTSDIVVMRAGRIEQRGAISELRDNPASAYVGDLIGTAMRSLVPLQSGLKPA